MIKKAALILLASVILSACSLPSVVPQKKAVVTPPATAPNAPLSSGKITIKSMAFNPALFVVRPGQKVTITNNDSVSHTISSNDLTSFDSGEIKAGATITMTAPDKVGSYGYHCAIHKQMSGTLLVLDE